MAPYAIVSIVYFYEKLEIFDKYEVMLYESYRIIFSLGRQPRRGGWLWRLFGFDPFPSRWMTPSAT